ncbi:hypothetical protein [Lacticaseibacillus hegangensis]|uniref:Uncharacterized protein n=1 Tax=Lacticaseibacillus hegangensis TaxID=2486010 RepID=A0ABW4CTM8_9LACO|nr:hypothetical protein [Lacticaseibacillus hegangensis]
MTENITKNNPQLRLQTDIIGFGPEPCQGAEVGQVLTITAAGEVKLERDFYARDVSDALVKTQVKSISVQAAQSLTEEVAEITENNFSFNVLTTDVGTWQIELLSRRLVKRTRGSVLPLANADPLRQWEVTARRTLGFKRLFLFDGGYYRYQTIQDISR